MSSSAPTQSTGDITTEESSKNIPEDYSRRTFPKEFRPCSKKKVISVRPNTKNEHNCRPQTAGSKKIKKQIGTQIGDRGTFYRRAGDLGNAPSSTTPPHSLPHFAKPQNPHRRKCTRVKADSKRVNRSFNALALGATRPKLSSAAMEPIPPGAYMRSLTRRARTMSLMENKKSTNAFMISLWKSYISNAPLSSSLWTKKCDGKIGWRRWNLLARKSRYYWRSLK